MKRIIIIIFACGLALNLSGADEPARIEVDTQNPGHQLSPTLWGIFFEDINCSVDGGLYAELVRNRSFEDSDQPDHWTLMPGVEGRASMGIDRSLPSATRNPSNLRVEIMESGPRRTMLFNEGYWGINVVKGRKYNLSLQARADAGFKGPLTVSLESSNGVVYAEKKLSVAGSEWQTIRTTLAARGSDPRARLVISVRSTGVLHLDMVSLFPEATWKKRGNGLRPDLAEMLAGMKPSFVRFPGGCWVEGDRMTNAYRWKQTIGPVAGRRTQYNLWQYQATHGIGYHEYLQLCEDLGAGALFVINCGMSHREVVPLEQMGEYVQDALDAIEYANGPAGSQWGAVRARHGHPKPFNLTHIQIGNENGGPAYNERYALFYDAIKAKYPEIKVLANEWHGRPGNRPIEILDEHYYATPEFFIQNAGKYDSYNRSGPKIYIGEFAVTQGCGQGNLRAAIGEAAFMTGIERNSDVVAMASYAPLFANVNYKKWNPDLINFDSSRVYGLPGYYVQQLFSVHRGDRVLPVKVDSPGGVVPQIAGAVGVGTWATKAEFKDIKVTRGGQVLFGSGPADKLASWRLRNGEWSLRDGVLRQDSLAENARAFIGDPGWRDYTLSLKARKLEGAEGFLISFLSRSDDRKSWWNLGGWGNVRHGLEIEGFNAAPVSGRIETGRWYDIRVEVKDGGFQCYLDNQLIHEAKPALMRAIHASATRDDQTGESILKLVNAGEEPRPVEITLAGMNGGGQAQGWELTSENSGDENSLAEPRKVYPQGKSFPVRSGRITCALPGNSLTVLRVKP